MKLLMENWRKLLTEWDADDTEHFDDLKSDNDYTAAGNGFKEGDVVKVFGKNSEHKCKQGTVTGMDGADLIVQFDSGDVGNVAYSSVTKEDEGMFGSSLYNDCLEQVNEDCWDGYERVPGSKEGAPGSCRKKTNEESCDDDKEELDERDAGMEVWMEKFKLHMRLPQNQPMDEFLKDNAMYAYRRGMDPKQAAEELRAASAERDFPESGMELYDIDEGEGLWKNIHAKRKRMKAGSGEKKAKPGDEDYPETLDVDEAKNPYTKEAQVADILAGLFEGCGEPAPVDYDHGPEASMHRSSLHTIKGEVEQLLYMIGEQDDLPEWLEAKITKARAYLSAAKDYLSGEQAEMAGALEERLAGTVQLGEKPAKGKKSSKTYTNPDTGRKNKVSYGQKGAKISPGTSKGDSYCARSFGIKKGLPKDKQNDPNTPNNLSRKKWKCKGEKSTKE